MSATNHQTDDSNVLLHHTSFDSRSLNSSLNPSARNNMDGYDRFLWWKYCLQNHKICTDDRALPEVIVRRSIAQYCYGERLYSK